MQNSLKARNHWRMNKKKRNNKGPANLKANASETTHKEDLSQDIQGNLTPQELKQLAEIKNRLANLHLPKPAHDAFTLYKQDQLLASSRSERSSCLAQV